MASFSGNVLYRLISHELFPHQIEGQITVCLRLCESDGTGIGTNPSQGVSEVHFLLDRTELDRFHRDLELALSGFEDSF